MAGQWNDCVACGRKLDPSDSRGCPACHPDNFPPERMRVQVELQWGYTWNGHHYDMTPSVGVTAKVMEHWSNRDNGYSFRGCPLGRTTGENHSSDEVAIEAAIRDFIRYGKPEYLGVKPLTRDMIDVVETRDYRNAS